MGLQDTIANRFLIDGSAGRGGTGQVFRARDLQTGQRVALKLLRAGEALEQTSQRFQREAQVLATLRHPHIVGYVDHGLTTDGRPYLATEWLEGEDLALRLHRRKLTLIESLVFVRAVAEGLAAAHRAGVIHRGLKPANLFLREGLLERVAILDFGILRWRRAVGGGRGTATSAPTQTPIVRGTLEYMAPEQARGEQDIPANADVFSLGCVLFECLTGQSPFLTDQFAGVLAKILFEDPPPLFRLRPEVPESVEALVGRMLAKDAAARPRDGEALLHELSLVSAEERKSGVALATAPAKVASPSLSGSEKRQVSVLVASEGAERKDTAEPSTGASRESQQLVESLQTLRSTLAFQRGRAECLANGTLVAVTRPDKRLGAEDQAALAARAALILHERWPTAVITLATGNGSVEAAPPIGAALERATGLLRAATPGAVLIDGVTAGLIDGRFELLPRGAGTYWLCGERVNLDESQRLLGKPSPCVGREQELQTLEQILGTCMDESSAGAVLILAPPGTGKSRLRHEFLRRMRARTDQLEILLGCGGSMSVGSPYSLLRQALRGLWGLNEGEPAEIQQQQLLSRVAEHVDSASALRVAASLGELCHVPFSDAALPALRAARRDPRLMDEQIGQALVTFLRGRYGAASARALLLVIEDLHWGEALSIKLIELLLRELSDLPFLVLALARPEVKQTFPNLWSGRVQEIQLRGLGRKASEQLVMEFLGREVPPAIVSRIVKQAAGNALFLEELIRAAEQDKEYEQPETVQAMLTSRIGRLTPEVRRVLRAGSVFGETFVRGGVLALLGASDEARHVDTCLEELVKLEILERRPKSRFAGETEYVFRQALVREAAYSLLTEADRRLAHAGAGAFLSAAGERDPSALAEHFERGGEPAQAVVYWVRAAEQSFEYRDNEEARKRAARGLACGAQGESLRTLRIIESVVRFDQLRWEPANPGDFVGLNEAPPGSLWWCRMLGTLIPASLFSGNQAQATELMNQLLIVEPVVEASASYAASFNQSVMSCSQSGRFALAQRLVERIEELSTTRLRQDSLFHGATRLGVAEFIRHTRTDPWRQLSLGQASVETAQQHGDRRLLVMAAIFVGQVLGELGDLKSAVSTLKTLIANFVNTQLPPPAKLTLAEVLSNLGNAAEREEAQGLLSELMRTALSSGLRGWAHATRASLLLRSASPEALPAAEAEVRQAITLSSYVPLRKLSATSTLVQILLAMEHNVEAHKIAEEALQEMAALGGAGYAELRLRAAAARARWVAGDLPGARLLLEDAARLLQTQAAAISDPQARAHFLNEVTANAQIQTLRDSLPDDATGSKRPSD